MATDLRELVDDVDAVLESKQTEETKLEQLISTIKHALYPIEVIAHEMPLVLLVKKLTQFIEQHQSMGQISLRYVTVPSMGFAAREIHGIKLNHLEDQEFEILIEVNFYGLQSTFSPLPTNIHEQIVKDTHLDINQTSEFLNFFNDLMIKKIVAIHSRCNYLLHADFAYDSKLAKIWTSLAGVYVELDKNNTEESIYHQLMQFLPLLMSKYKSKNNIEYIIEKLFRFKRVQIEDFVERNVILDNSVLSKLGNKNNVISQSLLIGKYKKDVNNACKIHIYLDDPYPFLPNGKIYKYLLELLTYLLPNYLIVKLNLHIPKSIPLELGSQCIFLGWTTQMGESEKSTGQIVKL